MKKIFICLMSVVMVFCNMFSSACSNTNGTGETFVKPVFTGGTHQFIFSETDDYLVKNSASDYRIVIASDASSTLLRGANDLQLLFNQATGVTLPIVLDTQAYFDFDAKLICLGKNQVYKEIGLTTDDVDLEEEGYIIKTLHDSIFIVGDSDEGTVFGIYGFLELQFNFDVFSNTTYHIDRVTESKLNDFDVIDVPDITTRNNGNGFIKNDVLTLTRMRYTAREYNIFIGSASAHTAFTYVDPDIYNNQNEHPDKYHPEWFMSDEKQLCYTAGGDEQSRELLLQAALESFKTELKNNTKGGKVFMFSQEDEFTWCNCQACTASKNKYNGSDAAVVIQFCNDLATMMENWMETEEGKPYKREFYVSFLSYGMTVAAPVDKNLKPIDDTVICKPNVVPMFAPIEMDYQRSLYHEKNSSFYKAFQGWRQISQVFNIFTYQSNYNYYLPPYDSFNQLQDFYQYAAICNTYNMVDLGTRDNSAGATGWQFLKNYLSSKLAWNVNSDVGELTDKFFTHYYGDAAPYMRKVYEEYRVHSQYNIECVGMQERNSVYQNMVQVKYWPKGLLDSWYASVEDALDAITYLKVENPEQYEQLYDNITAERMSLLYLMVQLYGNDYSETWVQWAKETCKEDSERMGIDGFAEGDSIDVLWQAWGII